MKKRMEETAGSSLPQKRKMVAEDDVEQPNSLCAEWGRAGRAEGGGAFASRISGHRFWYQLDVSGIGQLRYIDDLLKAAADCVKRSKPLLEKMPKLPDPPAERPPERPPDPLPEPPRPDPKAGAPAAFHVAPGPTLGSVPLQATNGFHPGRAQDLSGPPVLRVALDFSKPVKPEHGLRQGRPLRRSRRIGGRSSRTTPGKCNMQPIHTRRTHSSGLQHLWHC